MEIKLVSATPGAEDLVTMGTDPTLMVARILARVEVQDSEARDLYDSALDVFPSCMGVTCKVVKVHELGGDIKDIRVYAQASILNWATYVKQEGVLAPQVERTIGSAMPMCWAAAQGALR